MRSTDPALLAIEVQPRYRDLLSGHWPVVAGPEPDELLSSWLHRLAFGNGLPPRAFGPALDLGSGAWSGRLDLALPAIVRDRLVRCTGLTPGAVGGMTLAGVGARAAFVAVARRSFAGPARAAASRLAAILSAMSGRRRATVFPEGMAPGDDDRLRAPREPPARPLPGLRTGIGAVQPGVAAAPERLRRLRLRSRQREGAASRRGRPTRGRKFGGPRPTRDGRELRPRRRHPRPAGEARSAASGGVDGALMTSDRARALPALARDIDRLFAAATDGDASRKRRVENMPAAPAGVLACFARGLCGRAPAAPRPHLIEIAAVRPSSS